MGFGTVRIMVFNLYHKIYYNLYSVLFRERFEQNQKFRKKVASSEETSLIGYDERKCIFVHIPKTAGISLTNSLFNNMGGSHRTMKNYMLYYNNKEFNDYYKFCFVRNPWDRLVSSYHFLKQGGFNEIDKSWAEENLSKFSNFENFIMNGLKENKIQKYFHFIPQYKFVMICNKVMVDKVYKFEDIGAAFEDLQEIFCTRSILQHSNKTKKRSNYKEFYNREMVEVVSEVYKKDIKLFNYKFE